VASLQRAGRVSDALGGTIAVADIRIAQGRLGEAMRAYEQALRLAAAQPALAERISPELPDIVAEAAFAADHEQALTVGDVLLRRTRLGLLDARRLCEPDAEGVLAVARALGGQLDWDEQQVTREVAGWHELARVEGLVPRRDARAAAGAAAHGAPPPEPSPTAPGGAPEEAA
jgi:glycerol-3-phosphate dehydrogenase